MLRPIPGTGPWDRMTVGPSPATSLSSSSSAAVGNAVQQAVGARPTFAAPGPASFGAQLAGGLGGAGSLSPVLLVALVLVVLVAVK